LNGIKAIIAWQTIPDRKMFGKCGLSATIVAKKEYKKE